MTTDRDDLPPNEIDRIAQSIIAKSNYYVMSLYRELGERLPKDSVLLSPHVIELDENQRLTSRALLASEQVPTVGGKMLRFVHGRKRDSFELNRTRQSVARPCSRTRASTACSRSSRRRR